jgi:hypothetical protein
MATRLPLAEAGSGGKAKDEAAKAATHKALARMIDIPAKYLIWTYCPSDRCSHDRRTDNIIT